MLAITKAQDTLEREYLPVKCCKECCKDIKPGDRRDHYTLLHTSLFETPCRCCGSDRHTLLVRTPDREGYMQANFQCQIISHKTIQSMIFHQQLNREFWPCPFSLAKEVDYNENKTEAALERVISHGAGRTMKESEIRSFRFDAFNTCFTHRMGKHSVMIDQQRKEEPVVPITGKKPKPGKGHNRR